LPHVAGDVAGVEDGGDAVIKEGADGHAVAQVVRALAVPTTAEMGVHVGQPGKERHSATGDDPRAGRDLRLAGQAHTGDPVSGDDDGGVLDRRATPAVDEADADQSERLLEQKQRAERCQEDHGSDPFPWRSRIPARYSTPPYDERRVDVTSGGLSPAVAASSANRRTGTG